MKVLAVVSGGMDSVTMAHMLCKEHRLAIVSFDYGQRHKKELTYAAACAQRLGARHTIIDLSSLGRYLNQSALTGDIPVPEGHYAESSMRLTVVPNRNAIMLSVAFGIALNEQCDAVATAVHAGDHFIYPDCRPAFINAFARMQLLALEGFATIHLMAPFLSMTKAQIAGVGASLGVPFEQTWSCYGGGEVHCGRCGTCTERILAFHEAKVEDTTRYADSTYAFSL